MIARVVAIAQLLLVVVVLVHVKTEAAFLLVIPEETKRLERFTYKPLNSRIDDALATTCHTSHVKTRSTSTVLHLVSLQHDPPATALMFSAPATTTFESTLDTNLRLGALAHQCGNPQYNKHNRTALALEAYSLLRSMPAPDTVAYNTVLKALSNISPARLPPLLDDVPLGSHRTVTTTATGADVHHHRSSSSFNYSAPSTTAAEQARLLLDEMVAVHTQQAEVNQAWYRQLHRSVKPRPRSIDSVDDGFDDDSHGGSATTTVGLEQPLTGPPPILVKPNVRSYSTVMDAFARHANPDAAATCATLLKQLEQRYYETQDGAMEPNLIAFNTCLSAYAKAGQPQNCWDLYQRLPVAPDIISVNVVLHALARSGWDDAGERAQALLDSLASGDDGTGSEVSDGPVANARTYTTCMDAWGRCGRPDRAQALLDELASRYDATGDVRYQPNCVTYSTVIHAYAASRDPHKAALAAQVFRGMCERGIQPNGVVLNALLNCFATSRPRPDSMELVESLYRRILDRHPSCADQYTFGIALKAAARNAPPTAAASSSHPVVGLDPRDDFATTVFRDCCERGCVSSGVLWQLRQAVPSATYRELVGSVPTDGAGSGGDVAEIARLPPEWRRNVEERSNTPAGAADPAAVAGDRKQRVKPRESSRDWGTMPSTRVKRKG